MSTEVPVESKGKSKELFQYRTIMDKLIVNYIRDYFRDYPQFVAIHYREIETDVFDCRFTLNGPAESTKVESDFEAFIMSRIQSNSWKRSDKIYAYTVYLEDHYLETIKAVEREGLLPFMIEPCPELGEKAYTLYSYYSGEQVAGALASDLVTPRAPAPLEPLPNLAFELTTQLNPSRQFEFTVSQLLALEPEQAADKLASCSPLMREEVVIHLEGMREKKESAEKAELIMLHAAELGVHTQAEALHLLNLEPDVAVDLCLKAELRGNSKVVKALQKTESWKAQVILEKLTKNEALILLTFEPINAARILHQYDNPTRLRYISCLGQLKEDTPSLNWGVDVIFHAMLGLNGLAPPPSSPSVDSTKLPSNTTEQKLFFNPTDNSTPETLRETKSEYKATLKIPDSKHAETITNDSPIRSSSRRLSLFAPPPLPPEPLAVQSNGLSLGWKIFIGFIGISFVGVGVASGLYAALEKAEKIDATRDFFSNNYEYMLIGLGGAIGIIALGLLFYCTTCHSSNDDGQGIAQGDEFSFSSPFAPHDFMGVS